MTTHDVYERDTLKILKRIATALEKIEVKIGQDSSSNIIPSHLILSQDINKLSWRKKAMNVLKSEIKDSNFFDPSA